MIRHNLIEYALLCLLALVWGASYLFISVSLETIPPATLMASRVLIAALILWGVMVAKGLRFPLWPRWPSLFGQSILNATGAWLLLAWGQQYTDSGLSAVINSTSPIFVVLFSVFIPHLPTPIGRCIAGAVLGFLGVVLIIGPTALEGLGQNVIAQLAILGGAALYGLAALNGRKFGDLPPLVTATCTLVCAGMVLIPLALITDRPWTLSPTPISLLSTLALAVFSTAVAMILYFRLINTLGSLGTASQAYLRAGVGLGLGVFVLGEVLTLLTFVGLMTTITGVLLINWPVSRTST